MPSPGSNAMARAKDKTRHRLFSCRRRKTRRFPKAREQDYLRRSVPEVPLWPPLPVAEPQRVVQMAPLFAHSQGHRWAADTNVSRDFASSRWSKGGLRRATHCILSANELAPPVLFLLAGDRIRKANGNRHSPVGSGARRANINIRRTNQYEERRSNFSGVADLGGLRG
jgi:hypothetical protein